MVPFNPQMANTALSMLAVSWPTLVDHVYRHHQDIQRRFVQAHTLNVVDNLNEPSSGLDA
jgi:hypothetical protein